MIPFLELARLFDDGVRFYGSTALCLHSPFHPTTRNRIPESDRPLGYPHFSRTRPNLRVLSLGQEETA